MKTDQTHTPTPWRTEEGDGCTISTDDVYNVADTSKNGLPWMTKRANAAFIVRAANNHERLVDALNNAMQTIHDMRAENRLHGHITDANAKWLIHYEAQAQQALAAAQTHET